MWTEASSAGTAMSSVDLALMSEQATQVRETAQVLTTWFFAYVRANVFVNMFPER